MSEVQTNVDSLHALVQPAPDYKLSFGGRLSLELEKAGYIKEGLCIMDNGLTGVVYCRRLNAPNKLKNL